MRRWRSAVGVLILGASASACLPGHSGAPGIGRVRVEGKREPSTLVGQGGVTCDVAREKWETVTIGDRVWCAWQDPTVVEHRTAGDSSDTRRFPGRRAVPNPGVALPRTP